MKGLPDLSPSPQPEESRSAPAHGGLSTTEPVLPSGTVLGERYRLTQPVKADGEGFTYIGFDTHENRQVLVREFFPGALAMRRPKAEDKLGGGFSVCPRAGKELAFKSLLSDFQDVQKSTCKLAADPHIVGAIQTVHVWGTSYGIYPLVDAQPMEAYLEQSGGSLCWNEARQLITQLCKALGEVHRLGMLHGGVSPQTVLVDGAGVLYLTAFATTALRTSPSEIAGELFPGFAAPEQYAVNGWQGAWTDVYGAAALLYRMLLGAPPPAANSRGEEPLELWEVPPQVAAALQKALSLSPEGRYQSMEALSAALLQPVPSMGTAVFQPPKAPVAVGGDTQVVGTMAFGAQGGEEAAPPAVPAPAPAKGLPWRLIGGILLCSALLTGLVAVTAFPEKMPWNQAPVEERVPVPEPNFVPPLVGMHIDAVTANAEYSEKFILSQRQEFDETFPAGIVIRQSPPSGVKMINRGIIILTVSKGPVRVPMPDLVGSKVEFALQTLSSMGIPFDTREVEEYAPGIVGETSVPAGQMVNKQTDRITVYMGALPGSSSSESSAPEEESDRSSAGSGDENKSSYTRPLPAPPESQPPLQPDRDD